VAATAAVGAVGVVAVAGCASTTHGTGIGPAYTSLSGLAAQVSHAATQLTSVQGSLHLTSGSAGQLDETGTYRQAMHGGTITAFDSSYVVNLQGNTTNVRVLIVNGKIYVNRGQNGKPWLIATPESSDPVAAQLAKTMPTVLNESSVRYYVVLLGAGHDLHVIGAESVNGIACMHYHVDIDTRSAAKTLPGDQGQQMQQAADAGVDSIPLDLWVDAQGHPVKVTDTVSTEQASATVEVQMGHFNEDVHITAPPSDQISQD
jgi:hypothetical protein